MKKKNEPFLGTNKFTLGWGYRIYTMRGWVTLDTEAELNEELNNLQSSLPPNHSSISFA